MFSLSTCTEDFLFPLYVILFEFLISLLDLGLGIDKFFFCFCNLLILLFCSQHNISSLRGFQIFSKNKLSILSNHLISICLIKDLDSHFICFLNKQISLREIHPLRMPSKESKLFQI